MDKYILLSIYILLIFNLVLYIVFPRRKRTSREIVSRGAVLNQEELSRYAKSLATDHKITDKSDKETFPIIKLKSDFEFISKTYDILNESISNNVSIPPSGEWILDNFYIIEEQVNSLSKELTKEQYIRLPSVDGVSRIYLLAKELIAHTDGNIDEEVIQNFICSYQSKKSLSMEELWAFPVMLRIGMIENIKTICEKIKNGQLQKFKVESMIERLVKDENASKQKFLKYKNIEIDNEATVFVEYLMYNLKKLGKEGEKYVEALEEEINKLGTTINDIVKIEHFDLALRRVSMSNCILAIKNISRYHWITIFEAINNVENILNEDDFYHKLDFETRNLYRKGIEKIAKKLNVSEVYVAIKLIEYSKNNGNQHIGYYILGKEKEDFLFALGYQPTLKDKMMAWIKKNKVELYMVVIYLSTLLTAILVSRKFFVALLIPISEIFVFLVNRVLSKMVKPNLLPRVEEIPEDVNTFVVVPTLLNSAEKVKSMIQDLEVYYLGNKIENLFFALLGDASETDTQEMDYDEAIIQTGIEETKKLNEKYGKEIFFFLYRKRVFNEKQGKWLGYERKRGMLTEFNHYLLTKEPGTFQVNTISQLPKIKYVITLDADTQLIIDSAQKLIGIMEHPLNQPVIQNGIVVEGYGLIQPKVGISIEASTASKMAKIFAGSGGIDIYSTAESNLYQDVFGEAIFTGKGIYNVEVFQKVLEHEIPENTVLSHDLLEGSYIRCGLASDVEVMDGFPARYNSYMLRLHRWTRGDWQIKKWIWKGPLNALSKYKIFDNLRRSLVDFFVLLLFLFGFVWTPLLVLFFPLLFDLLDSIKIGIQKGLSDTDRQAYKNYLPIISGVRGSFLRCFLQLVFLPYKAIVMLEAIVVTLYRVHFSKKHLLEWVTAADAEKMLGKDLKTFLNEMKISPIIGIILVECAILFGKIPILFALFLFALWTISPIVAWYISLPEKKKELELKDNEKQTLYDIAKRTWAFFHEYMTQEHHFLPIDNYQENRKGEIVERTSSTNIGLGLLVIISAKDLKFITQEEMLARLEESILTIQNLVKWNGHLYNWYHTKTLQPLIPRFISTVDSGNFVGYLYVVKQTLEEVYTRLPEERVAQMITIVKQLIEETDFSVLYDEKKQLFSIGYDMEENKLVDSYYDLLASEARQASFVAIVKRDVPYKHWFNLGRTLTTLDGYKGLVSWSGTSFEYFMPFMIMKSYPYTLLDEAYAFSIYSQKKYAKKLNIPWGISESAFNLQDLNYNYQYRAFGIPWLGLKRGLKEDAVVAPYASLLTLSKAPKDVMENITDLQLNNAYDKFGFYDAIDYTPSRVEANENKAVVKTYMAHHQALILLAINNYLNHNILQERFHQNPEVKATEIILQERIPEHVIFTKEKKEKVQALKYKDYEEYSEKVINEVGQNVNILSNDLYTLLITDQGEGYSSYGNILVNRYKEGYLQSNVIYIKNRKNNRVWTNTLLPNISKPDKYHVNFSSSRCKFSRTDGAIDTVTRICIAPDDNVEIRQLELYNHSVEDIELEVTSYIEPILSRQDSDIVHPAFNNLFLVAERFEKGCILKRKARGMHEKEVFFMHYLVAEEPMENTELEVEKVKFIGRERSLNNPIAVLESKMFSNETRITTDSIVSYRNLITIKAGQSYKINYLYAISYDKEEVKEIYYKYNNMETITRTFELALSRSLVENRFLGYKAKDIQVYQDILARLVEGSKKRKDYEYEIIHSEKQQKDLWKFGISGDLPIILVKIKNINDTEGLKKMIYAQEYFYYKNIRFDLVILNEEPNSYEQYVQEGIYEILNQKNLNYLLNRNGGIHIVKKANITKQEEYLLHACSRVILDTQLGLLEEQVKEKLEPKLEVDKLPKAFKEYKNTSLTIDPDELLYYNEYGGFSKNGKEYLIRVKNDLIPPAPWVYVLANEKFGTILSNHGGGYTWFGNSRENKITAWSNNQITDEISEVVYFKDLETNMIWSLFPGPVKRKEEYLIRYGFGYAKIEHCEEGIEQVATIFVPKEESQKITLIHLKNNSEGKRKLELVYYINPVLGVSRDLTKQHIISKKVSGQNGITLQNRYHPDYAKSIVYLTSSEKIVSYTSDKKNFLGEGAISSPDGLYQIDLGDRIGIYPDVCAAIQIEVELAEGEEKDISFCLGVMQEEEEIQIQSIVDEEKKKLEEEMNMWENFLNKIQIKTPIESFNLLMNGWLVYQTVVCRLYARTSFYQSGGAFGFRDQLQDTLALLQTHPQMAKKQIVEHAKHQFIEGDVQHWWHPERNCGVRTRFSDDLLWLPYLVCKYIEVTGDLEILEVEAPYIKAPVLEENQDENYCEVSVTEEKDTIYIHCVKAIERSLSFGPNGLPRIGTGDWNDGMSNIRGESVWLGFFMYSILTQFAPICGKQGEMEREEKYFKIAEELKVALNRNAWDGKWYRRAFFEDGTPLGSIQNDECKIDGISQSWSVISGAGENDKKYIAMDSLDNYLVDRENLLIRLLTPAFDKTILSPGYIKSYVPGVRENGGQYTHGAIWSIIASSILGLKNRAFEYFNLLNPIEHARTKEAVAKYKVEPYVVAADVYSNTNLSGRGGWTWYTGSSSWFYVAGLEYILGIQRKDNKLVINPCIPDEWNGFEVTYFYEDTEYKIEVKNHQGEKKIIVDNNIIKNEEIILTNDEKRHMIEMWLE